MFQKRLLIFLLFFAFIFTPPSFAQSGLESSDSTQTIEPVEEYSKARVLKIIEEGEIEVYEGKQPFQKVEIEILEGPDKSKQQIIEHGTKMKLKDGQKVSPGEIVVIYRSSFNDITSDFQIIDKYRLSNIAYLALGFFILVLAVGRLQGLGSIIGLLISFLVIIKFIVPQIISGTDPILASIVGSTVIILTSIYFSHGFSLKTTVAILSTIITLIITGLLAVFAVKISALTGLGNEVAYELNYNATLSNLNLKGLLLGGIIIGTLGILDDVTTTQASTVFELKKANSKLTFQELLKRGFKVGKDHIAAVVNTLVLAYTGVSLPILLILIFNPLNQPLWLMLNSEPITEEIIRTLVGSFGLVFSVPITTIFAAWIVTRKKQTI